MFRPNLNSYHALLISDFQPSILHLQDSKMFLLLTSALLLASSAINAQETAPLLDLPVNLVEGTAFPNIQFFGGDIENAAMTYAMTNKVEPLKIAVNIVSKILRDNLGENVIDTYGPAKEFLFFVPNVLASQNNEDKTRSPFWSNSSPNKFSEIFCKQNNADNAACYERVLVAINTALAASAPVPRAPIYTAQITINQQASMFPFFQGDSSIEVVNTWFKANQIPFNQADFLMILKSVRSIMIKDQFFTALLVAEVTLQLGETPRTIRMFQGETVEKVAASFCDYHNLGEAEQQQIQTFVTNAKTEGVTVPINEIITLNINSKDVEVNSYAGDTIHNIARRIISKYNLGKGVSDTVVAGINKAMEETQGKVNPPAAAEQPAPRGNGIYDVMVAQLPLQLDGVEYILKMYQGENINYVVDGFAATINKALDADTKQTVIQALENAILTQQPVATVVQTTIESKIGNVVVYNGDSYNNVVRRYSSSNNLSYEDCVKINMVLEEHFNKEKESAVADAAAAEPVAEASQSEADASSEVEATPEPAATPEMKEFIQRIFQIPNNLEEVTPEQIGFLVVLILLLVMLFKPKTANTETKREEVPIEATKTSEVDEKDKDKKKSAKKKSTKKRGKSTGRK